MVTPLGVGHAAGAQEDPAQERLAIPLAARPVPRQRVGQARQPALSRTGNIRGRPLPRGGLQVQHVNVAAAQAAPAMSW